MMTTIWSASLAIQGAGTATTRPATTNTPRPATKQEVQAAARDLSEAIRSNVQRELNAAGIQGAIAQGAAEGVQGAPVVATEIPQPPQPPRTITIHGSNGRTETITIPPNAFQDTIPPQVVDISIAFFVTMAVIIIGFPLARAFARRMDRRGGTTAQMPAELSSQLTHLNQAVDAIALEVERISEGQRFTTRLLSEQKEAARQTLASGANR